MLTSFLAAKTVPRHKHSFWYYFGGLTLFIFAIQVFTGILLMFHYSPTPESAHESIRHLANEVPFGWLVRSLHQWSANLFIASLFIHFASVFFMRAYRAPRELIWMTGVVLLFIALGCAFTGLLLPWDMTAYFATQIGTEIPRSVPIVGSLVVSLLRGGEILSAESLRRMFALHVVILPLLMFGVIGVHVMLTAIHGSSVPIKANIVRKPVPFFPNFLLRDFFVWLVSLALSVTLSVLFPLSLGQKADPFASAPPGIKPEWYFLPLFQTLRMLPPSMAGINSELLVNGFVLLLGMIFVGLPLLDRKAAREERSGVIPFIGAVMLFYFCVSIVLAYTT